MKTINLECEECNGQGYDDVFVGCNKPASMCCGGCDARITCEECDGTGVIEIESNCEYTDRLLHLLEYFLEHNSYVHKKIIQNLTIELKANQL